MPQRAVTVTTTPQPFVSYNARRKTLAIFNNGTGTDVVFFSQDSPGAAAAGFPVLAQQAVALLRRDGDEPELTLFLVASAGTINVRLSEGFGDETAATGSEAAERGPLG